MERTRTSFSPSSSATTSIDLISSVATTIQAHSGPQEGAGFGVLGNLTIGLYVGFGLVALIFCCLPCLSRGSWKWPPQIRYNTPRSNIQPTRQDESSGIEVTEEAR